MTPPFRYRRFHILPVTGDPDQPLTQDMYISRDKLPGFVSLQDLGVDLYGLPRRGPDLRTYETRHGMRAEKITIGVGAGGCIEEWSVSSAMIREVQWLNHADWGGRAFMAMFNWLRAAAGRSTDDRPGQNPTWGGSYHGMFPLLAEDLMMPGYRPEDIFQGSINTKLIVVGAGTPDMQIETEGIPLEWDPDGLHRDPLAPSAQKLGGTPLDPLASVCTPINMKMKANHRGRIGLHAFESRILFPPDIHIPAEDTFAVVPVTIHPRFMFDQLWSFRRDTGQWTDLGQVTQPAVDLSVDLWERMSADNLRAKLRAPHGRQTGSQMGQVLGSDLDLPTQQIIFDQGRNHIRVVPPVSEPADWIPGPLGRVVVPEFRLFDLSNSLARFVTQDHVVVGPGTSTVGVDQTGGYWSLGGFGDGANAVIYRARADGPHPWSLRQDFAVGLWIPRLSQRHPADEPGKDQIYFRCARGRTVHNGKFSTDTHVLHWSRTWGPGAEFRGHTILERFYVVTGTWEQVGQHIEWLRDNA